MVVVMAGKQRELVCGRKSTHGAGRSRWHTHVFTHAALLFSSLCLFYFGTKGFQVLQTVSRLGLRSRGRQRLGRSSFDMVFTLT